MSYINGKEILPDNILEEIQKYFGGGLLYIPQPKEERCKWGSRTAIKEDLEQRNARIRQRKKEGTSIRGLMEEFHLSYDSIKRIIYRKN